MKLTFNHPFKYTSIWSSKARAEAVQFLVGDVLHVQQDAFEGQEVPLQFPGVGLQFLERIPPKKYIYYS